VKLKITVVSATIDPRMADGKKWDEGPAAKAHTAAMSGPFAAWFRSHPELEGTEDVVGEPVVAPGLLDDARDSDAPDPVAFVEIGGRVFRSALIARSFNPAWGFSFFVQVMPGSEDLVRLTVCDWDGPEQLDVIGTEVFPARQLVGGDRVKPFGRFGNVAKLILIVEPAQPRALEKRLSVIGTSIWTDTGIDVLAGQRLAIDASGQVCVYKQERCNYPDGEPIPREKNEKGFAKRGHGGLIGAIADTRFFVGREKRFTAPASGRLLLGVNDRDAGNNTGAFDVRVRLDGP